MHRLLIAALALDGALVGVFGVLYAPLYAGAVPVSLGVVVSLLTLPILIRTAGELEPHLWAAVAPLAGWLVSITVLASVGPGGDVMVPATWQSLVLILSGLGIGLRALRSVLLDEAASKAASKSVADRQASPLAESHNDPPPNPQEPPAS